MYARSPSLFDLAQQNGNIAGTKGPRGNRGNGDISVVRFILCIFPTLLVLLFFFNSRILQAGILQTGPHQFVENQFVEKNSTNWTVGYFWMASSHIA